ncbi:hypothetical protein [Acinetobacter silvestris]|uniref:DNA transfer protein p32 n=1 Tax=Acinetobacter silvestris TaxID=1977882 RepID=A0A1Y3CHI5_9GAMM|nr:hypothetical protein [Acinetobacter silvestris]OTG65838.1 hypothetical protein B9T28_06460 [Acinetobacter silvestris]
MTWVAAGTAAVSIGSSLYSGNKAKKAAQQAAAAQAAAANKAAGLQSEAFTNSGKLQSDAALKGSGLLSQGYQDSNRNLTEGYGQANSTLTSGLNSALKFQQPYANLGTQASGLLSKGLEDGSLTRGFNMSDFNADPGYAFRKQQGMDGIQSSAAAGGGLLSGATLKALNGYNSDLASQEYQNAYNRFGNDQANAFNRLSSTTQIGQSAANNMSNMTYNNASNIAGNQTSLSQLISQGLLGSANANAAGITSSAGFNADALVNSANAKAQGLYNAAGVKANSTIQQSNINNQMLSDVIKSGSSGIGALVGRYGGGGKTS